MRSLFLVIVLIFSTSAKAGDYVLAVSWEPEFCQHKSKIVECQTQTADRSDAKFLSLHGLWPQRGDYCGVDRALKDLDRTQPPAWEKLPAVSLTAAQMEKLSEVMPGTQSHLERHEWIKHGTCAQVRADDYFAKSVQLTHDLRQSALSQLIASRIGKTITLSKIRGAAVKSFGQKSVSSIEFICDRSENSRQGLLEIRMHLKADSLMGLSLDKSGFGTPQRRPKRKELCVDGDIYVDDVG
ncbi:MAG: ribonuclease [Gammaproteobacteria bacterium]|nr:ribonuclease [Gammaproteobacteria bacterium]